MFAHVTTVAVIAMSESPVAWGDYDNDGLLDIMIGSWAPFSGNVIGLLKIYRIVGYGNFIDSGLPLEPISNSGTLLMSDDYDQHGDSDRLFNLQLLRNETHISNSAPSVAEDTDRTITLAGFSPNGQPLQYTVTTPPACGVLTGVGSIVTYRPSSNYFGTDAFMFAVNDGMINSAPAMVAILVAPIQDTSTVRLSLHAGLDGSFQLTLRGEPCQRYRIDASEDLVTWFELTTVQAASLGEIVLTDATMSFRQRFYRPRAVDEAPAEPRVKAAEETNAPGSWICFEEYFAGRLRC